MIPAQPPASPSRRGTRGRSTGVSLVVCSSLSLTLACRDNGVSQGDDLAAAVTVSDSAGLEIVRVSYGAMERSPQMAASEVPTTTLGQIAGREEYLFGHIQTALFVDSAGTVAIVDDLTQTIRVFSSRGRFRTQFGGSGRGPGEFTRIRAVTADVTGTLAVHDAGLDRLTWIDIETGTVRVRTGAAAYYCGQRRRLGQASCGVVGILKDGTLLVKSSAPGIVTGATGQELEQRSQATLALVGDTWTQPLGTFDQGARFHYFARDADGRPYVEVFPEIFGGELVWATGVELVVVGRTDIGRLWIWDMQGKLVRVIDIVRPPRAVVDDELVALRDADWGGSTARTEAASAWIERTTRAEYHPVFGDLMIDSQDRLWLAEDTPVEILNRRRRGRRWFVIEQAGSPSRVVTLPSSAHSTVLALANQHALVRTVDSLGVQRVLRFSIDAVHSGEIRE